jgi:hypothetical protein
MGVSRRERLEELFRRLHAAVPSNSADEAFELVCRTLEQVEDELSGVPRADPAPPMDQDDGRMYRPMGNNIRRTRTGGIVAKTKGHRITVASDGKIEIRSRLTGELEFPT